MLFVNGQKTEYLREMINYRDRISSDPAIMLGKPVIKGTRITVEVVLQRIAGGYTFDEILEMYPYITKDDILSAVSYAAAVIASEEILQSV
jgi:uncharacterized protein (DUF433 family)